MIAYFLIIILKFKSQSKIEEVKIFEKLVTPESSRSVPDIIRVHIPSGAKLD
jgi:hypothetical protein